MRLIVISHAELLPGEAGYINALFDAGMEVFHLRKPLAGRSSVAQLLHSIDPVYWPRIALHQHHEMAADFGIYRLHLTSARRLLGDAPKGFLSTSIHGSEALSDRFQYAFFGPVFDSISKPGYKATSCAAPLGPRLDAPMIRPRLIAPMVRPRLIALGGITPDNARDALQMGFSGVAVLGYLWQEPEHCVKRFKTLDQHV